MFVLCFRALFARMIAKLKGEINVVKQKMPAS